MIDIVATELVTRHDSIPIQGLWSEKDLIHKESYISEVFMNKIYELFTHTRTLHRQFVLSCMILNMKQI